MFDHVAVVQTDLIQIAIFLSLMVSAYPRLSEKRGKKRHDDGPLVQNGWRHHTRPFRDQIAVSNVAEKRMDVAKLGSTLELLLGRRDCRPVM